MGRTLEAIADIAGRARIHVLVDEVYLDRLGGASVSPAALVSDRFISTSSLTKAYGLAGLRCGWGLAAPGVAARMRAARAVVAPTPPPAQRLALRAFAHLALLAGRARGIMVGQTGSRAADVCRPRRRRMYAAGRWDGRVSEASRVADVEGFVDRLLVEHHTAVVPGRFFGHSQHVRVAFGMGAEELAHGLEAVAAALDAAAHLETLRR